jgi:hypothetical protein
MNIFSKVLENWTNYELISIVEVVMAITAVNILLAWIFTKDKRSLLFTLSSLLSSGLITFLIIFAIYLINTSVTENYSFVFLLTITFSVLNIWTLVSFLVKNKNRKNFDIDFVTREHFADSLKLISFICIFFSILIAFIPGETRYILIAGGISSVSAIFVNIILGRIFFKDRQSGK